MPERFKSEQEILMRIAELHSDKQSFEIAAGVHDETADIMFKLIDSHRDQLVQRTLDEMIFQAKRHRNSAVKLRTCVKTVERELMKLKDALSVFRTGLLPGMGGDQSVVVE